MSHTCLRLALAVGLVAALLLPLHTPVAAQVDTERLHARLTKLPSLVFELWPADLNGDDITDLVAGAPGNTLLVTLGRGDGSFGPEHVGADGVRQPIGIGDLNGDGRVDVLAVGPDAGGVTRTYILPGRGDGTFDPPLLTGLSLRAPAHVVDMNADGVADVVGLGFGSDRVHVYPGAGDFVFGTPTVLPTAPMVQDVTVADLNGDSLPDIATVSVGIWRVDLFYSLGQFAFSSGNIRLDRSGLAITAADLNRDGANDLIVSVGTFMSSAAVQYFANGFVYVLLGRGDGTFGEPASYPTNNGPRTVVAGDFDGDAIPDLATGNLSYGYACEGTSHLWDSVSLLRGRGDGTLGAAASYALGNSEQEPDTLLYRRAHHRLNASDLNGDGRTDLIASPGAVLLATPPSENRPPVANAGTPRQLAPPTELDGLRGSATDPDNDWLTFTWTDDTGKVVGTVPQPCIRGYSGLPTFTLTVTDGRGGMSTDSVTHFSTPGQPLPASWSRGDIGGVAHPGTVFFDGATFVVTGSGADIWGWSDAFHFVQTTMNGDFDARVRVASLEHVHDWSKAGLMIRDGLAPEARHAFVLVTPSPLNGVAFQRRASPGDVSRHTPGPAVGPPVWLRLRREGELITAFTRISESDPWSLLGTERLAGLAGAVSVGLAVTSHESGTSATAVFDNFALVPITTALPDGWSSTDVGVVGAAGRATFGAGTFTLTNAGSDIWGTEDAFHFVHRAVNGDFEASMRVASLEQVHEWTKAGLMIRDGLSPSARHAFVLATPSALNGVAFQGRIVSGDVSVHTAGPAVGPPVWLRLRREGDLISAFARGSEEQEWSPVGTLTLPGLPATVSFGLAVTSHLSSASATAVVDAFTLTPLDDGLPDGWTSADVGPVTAAGGAAFAAGVFALGNTGIDIWDHDDAFQYVYRRASGDFDVRARVLGLDAANEWSKAGLMVRESLQSNARHHFLLVSGSHGLAHQWRPQTGGSSLHSSLGSDIQPAWFRITRVGSVVHLSWSADGSSWVPITASEFASGEVFIGLAVTSHDVTRAAVGTFDHVAAAFAPSTERTSGDVGAVGIPGSTTVDGSIYTLTASGHDIWGAADGFRLLHQPLAGDGRITARVLALQASNSWAKAGVMFRASADSSAAHAFALVSLSQGLAFQRRVEPGDISVHTGGGPWGAPYWVRLTRAGTLITASVSPDGVGWTDIGSESFPSMPATALVGLAVTSHDNMDLATASFDNVLVEAVASASSLAITLPEPGRVLPAQATFVWSGAGDEFWLEIGSAPGLADYYSSGSLGRATQHTVSSLPLNGAPMFVQVRRRIGAAYDVATSQYTSSIRRGLAVITDFADRRLEDWTGAGIRTTEDLLPLLQKMEDHWTWLARGRERIEWDVIRVQLAATATAGAFPGGSAAFRDAVAMLIRNQVRPADYDVDGDGEIDLAWLIVANGNFEFEYLVGGASLHAQVNLFADGQSSESVKSGAYGNFNHEVGHLLGLRDMYGPYDTLDGLTLMSFSWPVPARDFAAYERMHLGWVQPLVLTETTRGVWLPPEHHRLASIRIPTANPNEYFLIEYRRRPDTGFGSDNPAFNGLAVYHVLEGSSMAQEPPIVKLEPADGSIDASAPNVDPLDFVYPENPVLLRPMVLRSYFGPHPEVFRIENVVWRNGGLAFDVVMPPN